MIPKSLKSFMGRNHQVLKVFCVFFFATPLTLGSKDMKKIEPCEFFFYSRCWVLEYTLFGFVSIMFDLLYHGIHHLCFRYV